MWQILKISGMKNTLHLIHSLVLPQKFINHLCSRCCKYSQTPFGLFSFPFIISYPSPPQPQFNHQPSLFSLDLYFLLFAFPTDASSPTGVNWSLFLPPHAPKEKRPKGVWEYLQHLEHRWLINFCGRTRECIR